LIKATTFLLENGSPPEKWWPLNQDTKPPFTSNILTGSTTTNFFWGAALRCADGDWSECSERINDLLSRDALHPAGSRLKIHLVSKKLMEDN